jgi:hypothetical protein
MALSSEYFEYGVIQLVIAGASYVQAISGFAFALIVMGVITSLNLIQVAYAAIIVTYEFWCNEARNGCSKRITIRNF